MDSLGISVYVEWDSTEGTEKEEKWSRRASGITFCLLWKHLKEERNQKVPIPGQITALSNPGDFQGPSFLGCLVSSLYQEYHQSPLPGSCYPYDKRPLHPAVSLSLRISGCPSTPAQVPIGSIRGRTGVGGQVALLPVFHENIWECLSQVSETFSLHYSDIWQLLSTYYVLSKVLGTFLSFILLISHIALWDRYYIISPLEGTNLRHGENNLLKGI